ncbi:MAG: type 2 isopentenyl-diphosphate Delta-isomerase, partial [archaeon]
MPTKNPTKKRKGEHIQIVLKKQVAFREKTTGLEDISFKEIELMYTAIPQMDKGKIDTSTKLLSKKFAAPIMVSGMTGGVKEATKINKDIAKACQTLGLGMGVGSQRAMIEDPALTETYFVRDAAPDIFLAANIGAAQ